jgi:hypothetical protein
MSRLGSFSLMVFCFLLVIAWSTSSAFPRVVVAEEFTGTWCYYCPGAMKGLHNLHRSVGDSLAPIAYHKQDSFTIPGYWDRANFYGGVPAIPVVWFDGVIERVGGHHTNPINYTPYYNQRRAVESALLIELMLEDYEKESGRGYVTVTVLNGSDTDITGCLHLMMAGDDTLYNWQGFDHLYFTAIQIDFGDNACEMFPPGVPVVHTGQQFAIPEGWRNKSCTAIAFVQDPETREIHQAAVLHGITSTFTGDVTGGRLRLQWGPVDIATEYWVYGAANNTVFIPGFGPTYDHRLAVVLHPTTSWATEQGVGDPNNNWTYLVIAVDDQERERYRTDRFGVFDFGMTIP